MEKYCDKNLIETSDVINELIKACNKKNRPMISTLILAQFRNFVQAFHLKIYCEDKKQIVKEDYHNLKIADSYVRETGKYQYFSNFFYEKANRLVGHVTVNREISEAFLIDYFDYFDEVKRFVKENYEIVIFPDLNRLPLDIDSTFEDYYLKIYPVVAQLPIDSAGPEEYSGVYYVDKCKKILIDGKRMYEINLIPANDSNAKADKFVVFSLLRIDTRYAIKAAINTKKVNLFGVDVPVRILYDFQISIRPCELEKLFRIFGSNYKVKRIKEYQNLIQYMNVYKFSLNEVINFNDKDFNFFLDYLSTNSRTAKFQDLFIKCRTVIVNKMNGWRTLTYLLLHLNNNIIHDCYDYNLNETFGDLHLSTRCIPFERIPFAMATPNHKVRLKDALACFDLSGMENQIIYRIIQNYSEETGRIYVPIDEFSLDKDTLLKQVAEFNGYTNNYYKINKISEYLYVEKAEKSTLKIVSRLLALTNKGIEGYKSAALNWIQFNDDNIFGQDKKNALVNMFDKSSVFFIYGAAGTGKSTLLNFALNILAKPKKLCIAQTHPAVENMKKRIVTSNVQFKTIDSFLHKKNTEVEYDILIIDECSTVSNVSMINILNKARFKVLILCGDIYQLPSIHFGNWFMMCSHFIPDYAKCELKEIFRTEVDELKLLWKKVRTKQSDVLEYLSINNFLKHLDKDLFKKGKCADEIILCFNYDGLYGINNINRYLQTSNQNDEYKWGNYTYKVGDPIVFFDTYRFRDVFYNNMKGTIYKIDIKDNIIVFQLEVDTSLTSLDLLGSDVKFIKNTENNKTVVEIEVYKSKLEDSDEDLNTNKSKIIVPFTIAYAASIHKSQGLEYDSVKLVITNEVEERFTMNVFYTAITRAKKELKIYASPEVRAQVEKNLREDLNIPDISIIRKKLEQKSKISNILDLFKS